MSFMALKKKTRTAASAAKSAGVNGGGIGSEHARMLHCVPDSRVFGEAKQIDRDMSCGVVY